MLSTVADEAAHKMERRQEALHALKRLRKWTDGTFTLEEILLARDEGRES